MSDANGRGEPALGGGGADGWSTFEARMRRRRFERCLKTAESALESGERSRLKEALEEAGALFPDAPEVRALELRAADRAKPVERPVMPAPPPAPTIPPPPLEPAADFTLRPMAERAPLFETFATEERQQTTEPDERVSEPAYPTFAVHQKRSRSIAGPLLAVAAVALFAVGGYAFTEYYLAQPQPASRTAALTKSDPPAAPVDAEKPAERTAPEPPAASAPNLPATEEPATVAETAPPPSVKPPVENAASRVDAEEANRTSTGVARAMAAPATTPPPAVVPPSTTPVPPVTRAAETPAPAASTLTASNPAASNPAASSPAASTPTASTPAASAADASSREINARETGASPVSPVPALPESVATSGATAAAAPATTESARTDAASATRAAPSRVDEAPQIRAVLARYESAYNRLDANAASNVYPGVNREALGRAFGGLISQRVSLGLCEITVIGDIGGASCNGKARWEPKVGSGARTADRHWTFNLRRGADGWRIEQVVVR